MQYALPRSGIYRQRAEECRNLAKVGPPGLKQQYLKIAATYEMMADQTQKLETMGAPLAANDK